MTIIEAIQRHRKAAAGMRKIITRADSDWFGHGSSVAAVRRHRATMDHVCRVLVTELEQRRLAGLLTQEADLAARIAVRKRDGTPHRDLSDRLARVRGFIREINRKDNDR